MAALRSAIAIALSISAGACASRAGAPPAAHPANAAAPIGRLAGAPASLRTGVVQYSDVPAAKPNADAHSHDHHKHAP